MGKRLFIIIILAVGYYSLTAGGPWPQNKGQGYFKLSEWWIVFDKHYTDSGQTDPNTTTGIFNTFFYGEYGITDRFTVIVNGPIFSRTYMNNLVSFTTGETLIEGESLNSIGDIDLGFKYGITSPGSNFPIAATLTLGFPTGKTGGGSLGNLQTGDGEFNQMLQLDFGKGFTFGGMQSYFSSYVGINNRTEEFSEEFRYGVELGAAIIKEKLWLTGRIQGIESFKNGATAADINSTSIFANNTEFTSVALEANYYLNSSWGISASAATAMRGEIIASAPSFSFGVFYDMSK